VLVMPQYLRLHKTLWERQQSAMRRAQPEALAVAEAAKQVRYGGATAACLQLASRSEASINTRHSL